MLKCAITSGEGWAALEHVRRWSHEGVQYVQLREKQLAAGELVKLAAAMRAGLRGSGETKLLVNGRPDVAVAAGADGVHLTAQEGELTVDQVRAVFGAAGAGTPMISVSCHTLEEVWRAVGEGVDFILFGPVFEKRVDGEMIGEGVGLGRLQEACEVADRTPVLALGGVTWPRAELCIEAGASGVAGIRLFG
ncbi:thiamine phosphate synthase [Granulicella sp. L46]|jgi:thiamine-phosphate pyrophosphorylase|uniref:thiamine phosphate synthase n=1 Tax=Granulicella sp. L46 TaxID=1641865 RepID=UPI00131AE8C1|nr:thiamine phosphate synthase [Granulicella sp. L46]